MTRSRETADLYLVITTGGSSPWHTSFTIASQPWQLSTTYLAAVRTRLRADLRPIFLHLRPPPTRETTTMLSRLLPALLLFFLISIPTLGSPLVARLRKGQASRPRLQAAYPRAPIRVTPAPAPFANTNAARLAHAQPLLAPRRLYESSRTTHAWAPAPREKRRAPHARPA
jgi:hypothetical protein